MIILEGADGTGKTTLANALAKELNGMVLHAGFDKSWDIRQYHSAVITSAYFFENAGCPTIIDRWALSEQVYGTVFRGGPAYDVRAMLEMAQHEYDPIFIYCRNENAVENHKRNAEEREEMFDDISLVAKLYDSLLHSNKWGKWLVYDFNKYDLQDYVRAIAHEYHRRGHRTTHDNV
jgi:thymidylate kinase